jgi:hypothetical protein
MTNILNAYGEFGLGSKPAIKWPGDYVGAKPTADHLLTYHRLGARHGKQCLAGAMALREQGVTGSEITIACTAPQLNKMRGFITDGLVKRVTLGKRNNGEIYKLVLTPKGEKRVATAITREQALEAAGQVTDDVTSKKATKGAAAKKPASKPRKAAKPAVIEPSHGEPATVTVSDVQHMQAAVTGQQPDTDQPNT